MITGRREHITRKALIESDARDDGNQPDKHVSDPSADGPNRKRHQRKYENTLVSRKICQMIVDPLNLFAHPASL